MEKSTVEVIVVDKYELVAKRKPREKYFLRSDGKEEVHIYLDDVHYQKGKKYEEIDNHLVRQKGTYHNYRNDFRVDYPEEGKNYLMRIEKEGSFLVIALKDALPVRLKYDKSTNQKKSFNQVSYEQIQKNVSIQYKTLPTKVKETIVLDRKPDKKIIFFVSTNLTLREEVFSIGAYSNDKKIFTIEKPYMVDANGEISHEASYQLEKTEDGYEIELVLDEEWLSLSSRKYPVYVDPTITNNTQESDVQDTYIFPGDTGIDKTGYEELKAGVERKNGQDIVNRSLIKFQLPQIGTGCEIVGAYLDLLSYPTTDLYQDFPKLATVHRVTCDWNENNANWDTMHDKFDSRVESIIYAYRSYRGLDSEGHFVYNPQGNMYDGNITSLVKKWYTGTPNYGVMIKSPIEEYDDDNFPDYCSKECTLGNAQDPTLVIVYRNQSGLESYLHYKKQSFMDGSSYVNTFNGNLTTVWNLASTIAGKMPVQVQLVYNSHDVVLGKNTVYGKGYRLNYDQTLKEVKIQDIDYLEYIDEDGTCHYFYQNTEGNTQASIYYDEDGLDCTIKKENNQYILTDKNGNKMEFNLVGDTYYLSKITTISGYVNTVYRNDNQLVTKVVDANNNEITLTYGTNLITVTSPDRVTSLQYENENLSSITTIQGTTNFYYDSHHLISDIVDINGLKIHYQYYSQSPYKIEKVIQYGLNNTLGQSFTLQYGVNTTTLIDHKQRVNTFIYNDYGNLISSNSSASLEDIDSAYSTMKNYGDESNNKNKLLESVIPVKYVRNYLKNTSFEQDNLYFSTSSPLLISQSFSNDIAYLGDRSLKLTSSSDNQYVEQSLTVEKGKNYTFSAYMKNDVDVQLELRYLNSQNEEVTSIEIVSASSEFTREDVTIYYDSSSSSDLTIRITLLTSGSLYLDNIQLEEGEVANQYNLLENSSFQDGLGDWNYEAERYATHINDDGSVDDIILPTNEVFEVVTFNQNKNTALKVKMQPQNRSSFGKEFAINGKAHDLYHISFWYKNDGIKGDGNIVGNRVSIYFKPVGSELDYCVLPSQEFHSSGDTWQYFSFSYGADTDYEAIRLLFNQGRCANNLYITNLTFYKDLTTDYYEYDDYGNVTLIKNEQDETSEFGYDTNNQLIKATSPRGKNYKFEYDNTKTDQMLRAISSMGIANIIEYDEFDNPIMTKIAKRGTNTIGNGLYRIRSKGTNQYIKVKFHQLVVESDACSNTVWKIEKNEEDVKICHHELPSYCLYYPTLNEILFSRVNQHNLFNLEENENGSYYIKLKEELSEGYPQDRKRYLKADNGLLKVAALVNEDPTFEFYFESIDDEFIENSATYTEDGRFVTSVTDSLFHKTNYTTDQTIGLVTSMTNANNQTTNYTYNTKRQLTGVTQGDRTVAYTYDEHQLLTKITQGDKEYQFTYDDFLNRKEVKVGDNITLVTNQYEANNGNLSKTTYGNNQEISFVYDEFDRISKLERMDNDFSYKYDNNGNLTKLLYGNHLAKYAYDIGNRINRYRYDEFRASYDYDSNDNVTDVCYQLDTAKHSSHRTYDADDLLTELSHDDEKITYQYDGLGRLISKKINQGYTTTYDYVSLGKRTSTLVKRINNGDNQFAYRYDNLNNITDMYYNGDLIKHYEYDDYQELIKEIDYEKKESIDYVYDNSGNLLTKTIKNTETNEVVKTNTYQYTNSNWEDQLTKFDDISITYDTIGNPLSIGNNISLNWINGRVLNSYTDISKNLVIYYQYNEDNIRTSKVVNGVTTKYYLEGNSIIYEKRGNNIIYYLYDQEGIIGLNYQGNTYYFIKNLQGDIVGILDSGYNQVVSYEYDSWGNILSIKDSQGNEITDTTHIGLINPFRYRGYYYDNETKWYYLNSRYYNPEWGRFLNADGIVGANDDIIDYNLYAYVGNNPIILSDIIGDSASLAAGVAIGGTSILAGVGIVALGYAALKAVSSVLVNLIQQTVSGAVSATKDMISNATKSSKKKNSPTERLHNVYVLRNQNTHQVEYVGRTTNVEKTEYRHKQNPFRADLKIDVVAYDIPYATARGLEQALIMQCRTLNPNKSYPRGNQINGVAPEKLKLYWDYAVSWLDNNIVSCN